MIPRLNTFRESMSTFLQYLQLEQELICKKVKVWPTTSLTTTSYVFSLTTTYVEVGT